MQKSLKIQSVYQTLFYVCMLLCVQPKARTSSEESMAGEDDRARKPSSLYAPSPLIRTSSGTNVRPTPQPRSSRHSGQLTRLYTVLQGHGQSIEQWNVAVKCLLTHQSKKKKKISRGNCFLSATNVITQFTYCVLMCV